MSIDPLPPMLSLPLAYPVHVGSGLLAVSGEIIQAVAPAHRYAVISDDTVAPLHAEPLLATLPRDRTRLFVVPAGEPEKTRARWTELTDGLVEWGAGRDTTIVALGGGVVGDLAGFVAATYMRGVPVVQVPTTLLAMVDAAVGGKTGVDTPHGKNLVGAFHDPVAVIMPVEALATLPAAIFRSGLAEVLKHGVIADAAYFAALVAAVGSLREHGASAPQIPELVATSVRIKASVVDQDAREGGVRQTLNFGHTIAHALEQVMAYRILHGEAVAIGMVVEARIAQSLELADEQLAHRIASTLHALGLPTHLPAGCTVDALLDATRHDKKNREGAARYALPRQIGEMEPGGGTWSTPVPDEIVLRALRSR